MQESHSTIQNSKNIILIEYKTSSGKIYPLEIGFDQLLSNSVPIDVITTTKACQDGCKLYGRNGGCPPFAPNFQKIFGKNLFVVYAKLMTKYYPNKILTGPFYTRWAFVETFLTTLTNAIGKNLSLNLNGILLTSGNCRSCRPKKCAVKEGNRCRNIHMRTNSLESTGVIVVKIMKEIFNIDLQWWDKNNNYYIPDYMIKVIGIKHDFSLNANESRNEILKALLLKKVSILNKEFI